MLENAVALPALIALCTAASACAAAAAPPPAQAANDSPLVELDRRGGDVWAFERRISGSASTVCARIVVSGGRSDTVATPRRGRFAAVVRLTDEESRITAACVDRRGRTLAETHADYTLRLAVRPKARIRVSIVSGSVVLDAGASETDRAERRPLIAYRWRELAGNPATLRLEHGGALETATAENVLVRTPSDDGDYFIGLEVVDESGARDSAEAYFRVTNGAASKIDPTREAPSWASAAMVYGVVPALFGERPFEAVTGRLETLAALGVNTLWLT
ncbi:MAG: hypothetical protein H5U40_14395, partial [Polyangiaceae bacterium]|nr:hypothetical protein [Polyangiaceae bacterium]